MDALEKVETELTRYRHPLLCFSARMSGANGGVDVSIQTRDPAMSDHAYLIHLTPRELENPRFSWAFQKILYDSLHDYIIELFIDRP